MGRRDRERIQRILNGEEQPIAQNPSRFNQKVVTKAESMSRKIINRTVAPKWAKMDLPKQVATARRIMRAAGVPNFRATFLKDGNFPSDIQDKRNDGYTNDQIWEYYWGCPEFAEFWKSMELDEENLRTLVYTEKQ